MFLTLEMIRSPWMLMPIARHLELTKERLRMQAVRACRSPEKRAEVNRIQAEKARVLRRQIAAADGRELRIPAKTPEERKQRYIANQQRYLGKHRQRRRQQWRDFAKRNRESIEAYRRNRYHTDPQWNIMIKCRRRVWCAFNACREGKQSKDKLIKLLGCSFTELREHLEKQFTEGMTWQHVLDGKIHLDHKRPIAKFDLTDPAQVAAAFHYSNVQPLWAFDNHSKGAKYHEATTA